MSAYSDFLVALKAELDAGHPTTGPYNVDNSIAAAEVNAINRPQAVVVLDLKTYLSEQSYDNGTNTKFLFEFAEDLSDFSGKPLSPLAPVLTALQLEAGKFLAAMARGILGDPPGLGASTTATPTVTNYDESVDRLQTAGGCSAAQATYLKSDAVKLAGEPLNAYRQYIAEEYYANGTNTKVVASFIKDTKDNLSPLAPVPGTNQIQSGGFIENLYRGYQSEDPFNFSDDIWAGAGGIVDRFQTAGGCSTAQATELKALSNNQQSRASEVPGLRTFPVNAAACEQARALP